MFERLDTIDWAAVSHAYGPAVDVPHMLRRLVEEDANSPDKVVRDGESARWELANHVNHQGTVYSATAPTAAVLIDFLRSPTFKNKVRLIGLLDGFAHGSPGVYEDDREWMQQVIERRGGNFDVALREAQEDVVNAYVAVRSGLPVYLELLKSRDPALCRAVSKLLAFFTDRVPDIAPHLWERLSSAEGDIRIALITDFGRLVHNEPHYAALFYSLFQNATTEMERLVSAEALALIAREHTPEDVVAVLLAVIAQDAWATEDRPSWDIGATDRRFRHLQALGIPALLLALAAIPRDDDDIHELVDRLLNLAFDGQRLQADIAYNHENNRQKIEYWGMQGSVTQHTAETLNTTQRNVIATLVQTDKVWAIHTNLYALYGLPIEREDLRRLVAA